MLQIQTRNKAKNKNKDSPHPRGEVKSYIFFFPLVGFGIVNLPFTIIQINQDWQEILFQDIHLVVPPSHAQIYWLPPLANVHAIYHYVSFFAAKPNTDRPVTEKSKMDVFPPKKKFLSSIIILQYHLSFILDMQNIPFGFFFPLPFFLLLISHQYLLLRSFLSWIRLVFRSKFPQEGTPSFFAPWRPLFGYPTCAFCLPWLVLMDI